MGGRWEGRRGDEHGSSRGKFFRYGYEKRHLEFKLSSEFTASARRMKETDAWKRCACGGESESSNC